MNMDDMENKNMNCNLWILIIGIVIAAAAVIACISIFRAAGSDDMIIDETTPSYDLLKDLDEEKTTVITKSYYLSYDGKRVTIYSEPGRDFYDFADIDMDILPEDIREQLISGMYIDGEENLYDFLQTYSS